MLDAGEKRLANYSCRKARRERRASTVASANLNYTACWLRARIRMDDVNDAHEPRCTERNRRGSPDDLNPVEINQIKRCRPRVERPCMRNAVHHQQIGHQAR